MPIPTTEGALLCHSTVKRAERVACSPRDDVRNFAATSAPVAAARFIPSGQTSVASSNPAPSIVSPLARLRVSALATLAQALKTAKHPAVMCSFGKDSLAVLDLAARFGVRRVLYLEDRDEAIDETHIARTIERYSLEVTRMHSGRAVLYFMAGKPMLLGFPFVNRTVMLPIPTNVDTYTDGAAFTCVDDRMRAEHGKPLDFETDCIIMGFKLADWESNSCRVAIDQLPAGARAEYLQAYAPITPIADGCAAVFPLLHWSHADVWDYLESRSIPASPLMYDGRAKREHTNSVCYRCHDPYGPAKVACPKLGSEIMNLSHFTRDADLSLERIGRLGIVKPSQLQRESHGI